LKRGGFIVADCTSLGEGLWRLTTMLGFGRRANLIFIELKNGDFLALHAFTSNNDEETARGSAIGLLRKQALD
jgi:hypothetical protein